MRAFASLSVLVLGLSLTAGAASAQDSAHRVRIDDLDLATTRGAAHFDARVQRSARAACSGRSLLEAARCRNILIRQFQDALPAARRDDYARARPGRQVRAEVRVHNV